MKALHLQLRDHACLLESQGSGRVENESKQRSLHEMVRRRAPRSVFNAPIQVQLPAPRGSQSLIRHFWKCGKSRYHSVTLCSSQIVSSCIK